MIFKILVRLESIQELLTENSSAVPVWLHYHIYEYEIVILGLICFLTEVVFFAKTKIYSTFLGSRSYKEFGLSEI